MGLRCLRLQTMNRSLKLLSLALLLIAACKSSPKDPEAKGDKSNRVVRTEVQPPPPSRTTQAQEPAVRAVDRVSGTIREVRQQLRFVILDFGPGKVPQLDQKLSVYRGTDKVGEIKVSGPYRGTTVAADITAGEVKFGDLVREE